MNCAEIKPNLEAYALGALDPQTHAAIDRHLLECDACRRAALQYEIVAHSLPDALAKSSTLIPPAALKQNLLNAVQAEVEGHALGRTRAPRSAPAPDTSAPVALRRRWLLNPRVWMFSLALSIVVIFALIVWVTITYVRLQQALFNETAALNQVRTYQLSEAAQQTLIKFENPQQAPMSATDPASNVRGSLTFVHNKPYIVFEASNLPPLELNAQYFLWTKNEGRMQLVARFAPKPDGTIQLSFLVDREYPVLKRVILTRQLSLREIASEGFPYNESILEWQYDKTELPW